MVRIDPKEMQTNSIKREDFQAGKKRRLPALNSNFLLLFGFAVSGNVQKINKAPIPNMELNQNI